MIPLPIAGLVDPLVLVTGLLLVAAVAWWWTTHLTAPLTPGARRRWQERIAARADGFEREANVNWWAGFYDGLRQRRHARRGRRQQRADSRLRVAIVRLRGAWAAAARDQELVAALRGGRAPRPRSLPVLVGAALTAAAIAADYVLAVLLLQAHFGDVTTRGAQFLAVPLSAALFLAGRTLAIGLREHRRPFVLAGAASAATVALTLASKGSAPVVRLVVALAPGAVSALATVLVHRESAEVEQADATARRSNRRKRRELRRFDRRYTRLAGDQAVLAFRAVGPLVARPHVGLNAETAPVPGVDVRELLRRLGLIEPADSLAAARRLLDELAERDEQAAGRGAPSAALAPPIPLRSVG